MSETTEVLLSGSGGQGMILAGIILARAGIKDGRNVTQSQSYGPEARGGASRAEVILSKEEIDYPKVSEPDIVLAMTQEACNRYAGKLKPGGKLIVDPMFVRDTPSVDGEIFQVPITAIARQASGRDIVANIVALGVITRLAGLVSPQAIRWAVAQSVPRGTEELNLKALESGLAWGEHP